MRCAVVPVVLKLTEQLSKTKQSSKKTKKHKILTDVNHGLKSENRDYLAEVCGGKVGERAVEQRHDTDMAVTRSRSLRVSCQTDTQEMNCLTTLVGFGTILSLASSRGGTLMPVSKSLGSEN